MNTAKNAHCVLGCLLISLTCGMISTSLIGCSGGSNSAEAETETQVDPRFASAEALTDHINRSMTAVQQGNLRQLRNLTDAFYAETPLQERVEGMFEHVHAVVDLFLAANERYPDLGLTDELPSDAPAIEARVMTNDGQRATIRPEGEDEDSDMMLVKVGDRWYISGYTLEHDPDFLEAMNSENIDKVDGFVTSLGREARSLQNKLQAGDFPNQDAFMAAAMGSLFSLMMQHPEVAELMPDMGGLGGPRGMDAPPSGMPPGFPQ